VSDGLILRDFEITARWEIPLILRKLKNNVSFFFVYVLFFVFSLYFESVDFGKKNLHSKLIDFFLIRSGCFVLLCLLSTSGIVISPKKKTI